MARREAAVETQLEAGEKLEASVQGVIEGFTTWSSLGGAVSVLIALTVPRAANLGFWTGAAAIVGIVVAGFVTVLLLVGRPMARRHDPRLTGPYVTLAVTTRRVLVLDRALGDSRDALAAAYCRSSVGAVRYRPGRLLRPHHLAFRAEGHDLRFEFPRGEKVGDLSERLRG